jgi:hypothetical protein
MEVSSVKKIQLKRSLMDYQIGRHLHARAQVTAQWGTDSSEIPPQSTNGTHERMESEELTKDKDCPVERHLAG